MSTKAPALRFKQADGSSFPDWERNRLGELFKFKVGGDLGKLDFSKEKTERYIYPVYANATGEGVYGYASEFQYEPPAVTVTGRGNLGNAVLRQEKFNAIVRLIIIELIDGFDGKFLEEAVNNLQIFVESTGVPQLTAPQLSQYRLHYPCIEEQKKIATFLGSLDEKISKLQEKLETLETYKRGVMQKLFSQELRFRQDDGSSFPDWRERRIEAIGKVITGKTPATSQSELWNGDIPFVTPTDITHSKYQKVTQRTVNNSAKLKIIPKGSVMYTCIASIGKMSLTTRPSTTNQQINSIIPFTEYNAEFLYYALLYATPRIKSLGSTDGLALINKKDFSKYFLRLPSQQEQKKIANFLTALDDKIAALRQKIAEVETYKRGLLQQMFI